MNEMTHRSSGAVAVPEKNYYEQYADAASVNRIVGDLLKFSKGDWLSGRDGDEVAAGTRLVCNMSEFHHGWVRWADGKPTDQILGKVSEGHQPQRRGELGDTDKEDWELDDQGQKRDPWVFTNYLVMIEEDGDKLFTFTTSSKGGLGAIAALCKAYGPRYRQNPNAAPIIALEVDSYKHSDKTRGRIKVPVLEVVGWTDNGVFADVMEAEAAAADQEAVDDDSIPFSEAPAEPVKARGGRKTSGAAATAPQTEF